MDCLDSAIESTSHQTWNKYCKRPFRLSLEMRYLLSSKESIEEFFVCLHGENEYQFSFVEKRRKLMHKFTWCFHKAKLIIQGWYKAMLPLLLCGFPLGYG